MAMKIDGQQGRDAPERDALDDLFAEARRTPPLPSETLMARILADAKEMQPRAALPMSMPPARGPGFWMRLSGLFGGAGALAGMGTAAAAGLFIGFAQPVDLSVLGDAVLGAPLETVELMPSVDTLLGGN